ncbi:MAG: motility associated factor glycosyltransferase family protein [Firmicutes bacterium]|nr:motility associated factor glycosyltransferase family protein [Bacillota bacterium]
MLLKKNLAVLKKRYPVYQEILEDPILDQNISIVEGQNGSKTALYQAEGDEYLLHSKYNPEREAERLVAQLTTDGVTAVVVLGFAMGYHLKELFDKVKDKGVKIFVIENNPALFQEALRYNDFTNLFSYQHFYLYLRDNYDSSELINFIEDHIDIVFEELILFKLPTVKRYFGKTLALIEKDLSFTIRKLQANKHTSKKRGKVWEENLLNNLYLMLEKPGVKELKDLYRDQPAIVVAAGPSLDKNMHLLKEVRGKALVIAVDAVLKTLLKNDIIPDIVTVIDGYIYTLKYFKGIDYEKLKSTILVTIPQFYNHILEKWPGPVIFSPGYGVSEDIIYWIEKQRGFLGRLATGGSVAHLAFVLAHLLAADPIVFVGQDLAFSDNNTHVSGSDHSFSLKDELKKTRRKHLKVEDIYGNKVWTRSDFHFYLQWFNRTIRNIKDSGCRTEFIDATEGGARIEGTRIIPLKEVINDYCHKENNKKEQILSELDNYKAEWNPDIIKDFQLIINNLKILKKQAEQGLLFVDKLLDCTVEEDYKKTLGKMKTISNNISILKKHVMFFESEMYDIYDEVNVDFRNNLEKYGKLVEFYNLLIKGCNKTTEILKQHYQKILLEEGR